MTNQQEKVKSTECAGPQAAVSTAMGSMRDIENIAFKNLLLNSILALSTGFGLFLLIRVQQHVEFWSLSLLLLGIALVTIEDLLSWIRWQVNVEKCLKSEPQPGFWMKLDSSKGRVKAEIGSLNYPDRTIWQCDVFLIKTQSQQKNGMVNTPVEGADLKAYMQKDTSFPVAIETDNALLVVKPPARLSMILIENIEHWIGAIFRK